MLSIRPARRAYPWRFSMEKIVASLKRRLLFQTIALTVSGLKPRALSAVQRDAEEWLEVDDHGNVVPKRGSPTTLHTLTEHLKRVSPYYFGDGDEKAGKGAAMKTIKFGDSDALSRNLDDVAEGRVSVTP